MPDWGPSRNSHWKGNGNRKGNSYESIKQLISMCWSLKLTFQWGCVFFPHLASCVSQTPPPWLFCPPAMHLAVPWPAWFVPPAELARTPPVRKHRYQQTIKFFSSVQSLDQLGHHGGMRDDSAEVLFQSFLQVAVWSNFTWTKIKYMYCKSIHCKDTKIYFFVRYCYGQNVLSCQKFRQKCPLQKHPWQGWRIC